MTQDQATALLAMIADLQQQGQALGHLLGRLCFLGEVAALELAVLIWLTAIRRT